MCRTECGKRLHLHDANYVDMAIVTIIITSIINATLGVMYCWHCPISHFHRNRLIHMFAFDAVIRALIWCTRIGELACAKSIINNQSHATFLNIGHWDPLHTFVNCFDLSLSRETLLIITCNVTAIRHFCKKKIYMPEENGCHRKLNRATIAMHV